MLRQCPWGCAPNRCRMPRFRAGRTPCMTSGVTRCRTARDQQRLSTTPIPLSQQGRAVAVRAALKGARHVAIVRLGSIGDVVASLPIAWYLREFLGKETKISWIVHGASTDLLAGFAALDDVITLPKGSLLGSMRRWRRVLAAHEIDAVVDIHGNLKSGVVDYLTGAKVRIGFHRRDCRENWNPLFTTHRLPRLESPNKTGRAKCIGEVLECTELKPRFGLTFGEVHNAAARRCLGRLDADRRPVAVLQLGRIEDVRSWPAESFATLADRLLVSGYSVLVLAGPQEIEAGHRVQSLLKGERPFLHFEIGSMSLAEVGAAFVSLAAKNTDKKSGALENVFVGGDSGCLHLAAACGLPSLALFGPQDPERTAPIGENVRVLYHPEVASCIPCSRRECHHPTQSFCMRSITVDEVVREVLPKPHERGPAVAEFQPVASVEPRRVEPPHTLGERIAEMASPALAAILVSAVCVLALQSSGARAELWETALRSTEQANAYPGVASLVGLDTGPLARLISLGAAFGCLLLTFLVGRQLGSSAAGLIGAAALSSSALFHSLGTSGPSAAGFAFLVNLSFFLYVRSEVRVVTRRRWSGAPAALAAVGAFATRGVVGLLLPSAAIVAFLCGEKSVKRIVRQQSFAVVACALVAAGLWLAIAGATAPEGGDLFEPLSSSSTLSRWSYLHWFVELGGALLVLGPLALIVHLKNRRYREDLGFADRQWRFPKAAFLGGILVVHLLPGVALDYVIALLPSLCVLIGAWLERIARDRLTTRRGHQASAVLNVALICAGLWTLPPLATAPHDELPWLLPALFAVLTFLCFRHPSHSSEGVALRLSAIGVVTAALLPA